MIASDAVSRAVLDKYNSFQAKLRPSDDQFTVLASIVAYKKTREEVRVLSIATGTKCCGHSLIDNYVPGSILVDSHAEILSRRGFIRYLLNTIRLCLEDPSLELSDDVLIERKGDRWGFKDSWEVFLYVSDPPCGDCAIYDRDDHGKQSMNFTGAKLLVDTPGSTVDATGQDKEETDDDENFSRKLASLGDIYINDAFSCSHRKQASVHNITKYINKSYAGPLLKKEIDAINLIIKNKKEPVTCIIGGSKISTKINIIEFLITKMDFLVIGGAMANTFILAKGYDVGKSMVERDAINLAKTILEKSKKFDCKIILPEDLVVSKQFEENSDHKIVNTSSIPSEMMALDIGPKSIENIKSIFENIKTLLWNGPLGAFEINPFGTGTFTLAKFAADLTIKNQLITVAGGGDTASALNKSGVAEDFTYISSAGGAFLEWLEGIELPAISALGNN